MKLIASYLCLLVIVGCGESTKDILIDDNELTVAGPSNGTLIIIGGNVNDEIWNKFKELMGGADEPLVVIPTAISSDTLDQETLDNYKDSFIKRGFNNVSILHTRDRDEANSDAFIEQLKSASGVWFSGGRQWRHADSYLNTKTHEAFRELLNRGGVIAGSSAGATIQGSYLARGDSKTNTIMMGDHEEGLGFITNVAIDQHLLARNRQFDMFEILDYKPNLLGIGLDEKNTAIVVRQDKFSVIGESYVVIYDGTRYSAERDTIYQLAKDSREFYTLRAGDEYDLNKRRVIRFKDREFINLTAATMSNYVGKYYEDGNEQFDIIVENDTLKMIFVEGDEKYPILPESEKKFFNLYYQNPYEFELTDNGQAIKLVSLVSGRIYLKFIDE